MYYALLILLLLVLFATIFCCVRRKRIICKIRCMEPCDKCSLLTELAEPFGYDYHCCCGIFSSTIDAWQKTAGYTWLYDYMAPRFNMVFDALPMYFDYQGKTWLVEFWKGQYGINTGAEIEIYHADKLLKEAEYKTTLFTAADDCEMLPCTLRLYKGNENLAEISQRHWWLTAFLPGCFSKPDSLCLEASICFPDSQMRDAFCEGLCRNGYDMEHIYIHGLTVSLVFDKPCFEHYGLLTRFHRWFSQCLNRIYCKLYICVTKPFTCTADRILYLYYFLPVIFRRILRLHRFHRHCHKKHGCRPPKKRCRSHCCR